MKQFVIDHVDNAQSGASLNYVLYWARSCVVVYRAILSRLSCEEDKVDIRLVLCVVLKFARAFCYLIVKYGEACSRDMLMFFIACAWNRRY